MSAARQRYCLRRIPGIVLNDQRSLKWPARQWMELDRQSATGERCDRGAAAADRIPNRHSVGRDVQGFVLRVGELHSFAGGAAHGL